MEGNSERGTVTAELAIALPAVLLMLTLAIQLLMTQVERVHLAAEVGALARAAARGEALAGSKIEGTLVCVTKAKETMIRIEEKQCARRLGM